MVTSGVSGVTCQGGAMDIFPAEHQFFPVSIIRTVTPSEGTKSGAIGFARHVGGEGRGGVVAFTDMRIRART